MNTETRFKAQICGLIDLAYRTGRGSLIICAVANANSEEHVCWIEAIAGWLLQGDRTAREAFLAPPLLSSSVGWRLFAQAQALLAREVA